MIGHHTQILVLPVFCLFTHVWDYFKTGNPYFASIYIVNEQDCQCAPVQEIGRTVLRSESLKTARTYSYCFSITIVTEGQSVIVVSFLVSRRKRKLFLAK